MGAMGFGPIESDSAADWVAENLATRLFDAIESTLRAYLGGTEAVDVEEAEVAAALLVDCTSSATVTKYGTITNATTVEAVLRDLWTLAIAAVDKLVADGWPARWDDPAAKSAVLAELRADLQGCHEGAESTRTYLKRFGRL